MNIDLKRIPAWAYGAAALALLFIAGSAAHSAGWSQGFVFGLLAGGGAGDVGAAPYLAYRAGPGWHGFGPAAFFGGIFRFGLLLLFVAFILRCFSPWRWRHMRPYPGQPEGSAQAGPPYGPPYWQPGGWQPPYPPAPGGQPGPAAAPQTPGSPPPAPEQPGPSAGAS